MAELELRIRDGGGDLLKATKNTDGSGMVEIVTQDAKGERTGPAVVLAADDRAALIAFLAMGGDG